MRIHNQPQSSRTVALSLLYVYIYIYTYIHYIYIYIKQKLTIASAVMDSFIQRFSSNKWPITMQAQRSATKRFMETTELWSEVVTIAKKPPVSTAIALSLPLLVQNTLANPIYTEETTIFSVQSLDFWVGSLRTRISHSSTSFSNSTANHCQTKQNVKKKKKSWHYKQQTKSKINFLLLSWVFSLTKQRLTFRYKSLIK